VGLGKNSNLILTTIFIMQTVRNAVSFGGYRKRCIKLLLVWVSAFNTGWD